jgi:hypothetical protein
VDEIRVEFQWEREEYYRVIRRGSLARVVRSLLISSLTLIFGGSVLLFLGSTGFGFFFLGLAAFYIFLLFWIRIFSPKRAWEKTIGIREPISIVFDRDGITTKASESESKLSWNFYPISREWSDFYFLQRSRRGIPRTVPKRGFASAHDESRFRALLESRTQASLLPNSQLDWPT